MKTLKMAIKEFLNFRACAEMHKILFTYGIKNGEVTIQAKAEQLELIGY